MIFQVDDILSKTVEEPAPAARKHLTLEEKQRLAKSKEQVYQMKKVGDLKPVNVAKPIRPPIKVDNKVSILNTTFFVEQSFSTFFSLRSIILI